MRSTSASRLPPALCWLCKSAGSSCRSRAATFHRKSRHSTEWRLTEFGCDVTGSLATKNFTRWQPKTENPVPPQDRTVPVAGPIGPRSGTVPFQKARYEYLRRDREAPFGLRIGTYSGTLVIVARDR